MVKLNSVLLSHAPQTSSSMRIHQMWRIVKHQRHNSPAWTWRPSRMLVC